MRNEIELRMRAGEAFHALRVPAGVFTVVRVDGRSFSALTERLTEKPFDAKFHAWMVRAASGLLESLGGVYAFTESDEISVLLPRDSALFDREVEKLVSISAARASAIVSLACGEPVEFDARIWVGARDEDVIDYFQWRQSDGARCALQGWCYWTLRKAGLSAKAATSRLERADVANKNELLFSNGVNFNEVPLWQRRGTGLYWESYEKTGFNPITKAAVVAVRRRVAISDALPMKDAYAMLLRDVLQISK